MGLICLNLWCTCFTKNFKNLEIDRQTWGPFSELMRRKNWNPSAHILSSITTHDGKLRQSTQDVWNKKGSLSKQIDCTSTIKIWVIRHPALPKILGRTLSPYPTRTDKSFTLLLWRTTQLIQYVPIHDKNPVTSWQCFEMHIFNTDLLSAKLQRVGHHCLQRKQ